MIDIGVNLTNSRFSRDLAAIIERAQQKGLSQLIVTGTSVSESQRAIELCQHYPDFLSATAGVHPHDAEHCSDNFIEQLEELAQHNCVKAIGECGLDFNRNFSTPEKQLTVFKQQIALAAQLNMPLFLHQRDAFEPWFELLKPFINKVPAMITHCFTGNEQELKQCLAAGMYIGITGWVCDERRGVELQQLLPLIPLERLLIETDAPYLLPRTIKPRPKNNRNEPSYLPYVIETIADKTHYSYSEIVNQTTLNAQQVFNLAKTKDFTTYG